MKKRIAIIIPVFNESKVIHAVLKELKKEGYRTIIVVDDGSSDNTYEEIVRSGVVGLHHGINRGKGAAIKTGMEAARLLGITELITFDGDGQHDPRDISKMLAYLNKGYDVVLGSRFQKSQHIPILKKILNTCANYITYILYGVWVSDSQSGFRGYNNKALNSLALTYDRYEFDSEVIREIHEKNLSYIEMPIRVRYTQYSQKKQNKQNISSALQSVLRLVMLS